MPFVSRRSTDGTQGCVVEILKDIEASEMRIDRLQILQQEISLRIGVFLHVLQI
jgi:hypothetical protein